jgi:pimeloyl-ACP methyl ester carboxylesterase
MIKKIVAAATATAVAPLLAGPALAGLGWRAVRRRQAARRLAITSPNGIDQQLFVPIGGAEQWISIRGEDRTNPVLLVLHGGPGSPYSIFTPRLRSWERDFTVVQWDRRGVGRTLRHTGVSAAGCTL